MKFPQNQQSSINFQQIDAHLKVGSTVKIHLPALVPFPLKFLDTVIKFNASNSFSTTVSENYPPVTRCPQSELCDVAAAASLYILMTSGRFRPESWS